MRVVHFTEGATEPLREFGAQRARFVPLADGARLDLLSGMGLVIDAGERFTLESPQGAIVLLVESERLAANERGISSPERIKGQRWPGEPDEKGGTRPARGALAADLSTTQGPALETASSGA